MKQILLIALMMSALIYGADNEIQIDQTGGTLNADIEQLGSGNLIGGSDATAGDMTALDLDGATMTIDINQIGDSNLFKGDITSDTFTGFFNFDGNSNIFDIQVDPTNTYGADNSDLNIQVSGSSNDLSLDQATTSMTSALDLDWIIQGDSNIIDADIDVDLSTNYMDIDGNSNQLTFDSSGYQGGYFYIDHTGNSRNFSINQQSTLDNDWLRVFSNGDNGTFCINQNDGGTSTSC